MKLKRFLATAVPTLLLTSTALAVQQPAYLSEQSLEVASGGAARAVRKLDFTPPAKVASQWRAFQAAHGAWTATWDQDTGVPSRIYGEGIDAPGVMKDDATAEAAGWNALAQNVALLAPGADVGDFVLARNVVRAGVRSVDFAQTHDGLPVVGAYVSFAFEHDRLVEMASSAAPNIGVAAPGTTVARSVAEHGAQQWVASIYQASSQVLSSGDAQILPIVGHKGIDYRVVVPVIVDQPSPRAQWTVYVDAVTGAPVARHQRLWFGNGTVKFHVPTHYPAAGFGDAVAPDLTGGVHTDGAGAFSWSGTSAQTVTPGLSGTYAHVTTATHAAATGTVNVPDGGFGIWDQSATEYGDAQLAAYINANIAKQYALAHIDSGLAWLHQSIPVIANEDENTGGLSCNAFSAGDDIHFFISDSSLPCNNSGEIADVLFHEFGHSLNSQSAVDPNGIDGAFGEGQADYYAATVTNDPDLGRGFFASDTSQVMRSADPAGHEFKWPDDIDPNGDPHATGQILSGALWDLRKAAIAAMGDADGRDYADHIYYGIIIRAGQIPDMFAEALVQDDDDGNLANGTPNECMIRDAFAPHGLGDGASLGMLPPPALDGLNVTIPQLSSRCAGAPQIASARIDWHLRDNPATAGSIDMTAGASDFTATLPSQPDGSVMQYQVVATLDSAATAVLPNNPADLWYEMYFGPVTNLYCTDFEAQPSDWTLGQGFEWGTPTGGGTDPSSAYSGSNVLALNLSGNYQDSFSCQSQQHYSATSPVIDTTGYSNVRLQYRRWLGVEDASYDQATIQVNGATVWQNAETASQSTQHVDQEWRFQDVDLSDQASGGTVQVTFDLAADCGLDFGGWTVDDFCIVAVGAAGPACGDGNLDDGEECDDGNHTDGDGCSAACADETGAGGGDGGCCSTDKDAGAGGPLLLGLGLALAVTRRRRRG
jgi:MYXO-CTERM domain-containing protein